MAHFFVVLTGGSTAALRYKLMISNKLQDLVVPELEALGFECVKLEVAGSSGSPVVRLYIDKPGGVSIGDCSLVSRTIGLLLDREDPFPGRYLLEVSSPGSNRPLVTEAHFRRFAGESAKVRLADKNTYTGRIQSCEGGVLTLETTDNGRKEIRVPDIVDAWLVGREYRIDKKMKRPKRKKRVERSSRGKSKGEPCGTPKGEEQ